jgi:SAM-dependent methyltransferase
MRSPAETNLDPATVAGFGDEWTIFDQSALGDEEGLRMFSEWFAQFDFTNLGEGFDLGCGSGRFAKYVAPHARLLHCIDPSAAIEVARRNLSQLPNVRFHHADADHIPLRDQDFGYCIGVIHHIPDPQRALIKAVAALKPGAQFLLYVYYRFDNRPTWFQAIWKASDILRRGVSRSPLPVKRAFAAAMATLVYWPVSRFARLLESLGIDPSNLPLNGYRRSSFYRLRTDAFDRFCTRLEHRFTRDEVRQMMERAGLTDIRFNEHEPYWTAIGRKVR